MGVGGTGFFAWGSRLERYQSKWDVSSVEASILATKSTKDALDNQKSVIGYNRGTLIEPAIIAEDGTYPVNGRHSDGYWYVKGAKVNTAPNQTQIPTQNVKVNELITLNLANFFNDIEGDVITYTTASSNNAIATSTVSGNILTLSGKAIGSVAITVTASDGKLSTTQSFTLNVTNTAPTVTLTSPINNLTLYENDVMSIAGNAYDSDKDQSVTVYFQINSEQRKVLATNLSQIQIALSKQLTFKAGKLFDGEMLLTNTLAEGVAHTLKIWAVDNENGQSATIERTFYVVPNRAPLLIIDAVVPSGIINADKFKVRGTATDQDANSNVKVNYRINGANPIEIFSGSGGAWEFDVSLVELVVGENTIVVEVIDNYQAKTSKTIKLNKNEVKTPILQSVARYQIFPPKGSARGVLIWIQRDKELDLKVELSMTLVGEQEQFILLEADPDHIIPVTDGVVEDEYHYETIEPKDNIILKLTSTRANIQVDNKIYLIMGVVE
ncbi:hypothetical protein ACDX69_10515 [Lysinibacillus fusiformis]